MNLMPWILSAIVLILVVLGIFFLINLKRNKKRPLDYRKWFIIGIIWMAISVPLDNYTLLILGIVFTVLGLVNYKKWEKNKVSWNDLTKSEKRFKIILIIITGIILLLGLVFYFFFNNWF